jgi:hypothetical protein
VLFGERKRLAPGGRFCNDFDVFFEEEEFFEIVARFGDIIDDHHPDLRRACGFGCSRSSCHSILSIVGAAGR